MRKWLFAAVLGILALAAFGGAAPALGASAASNPIAAENAKAGTTSWFVGTPRQDEMSGYFDRVSYLPGATATLYADSHGDPFSYTVYRMGYYQGLGGRKLASGTVDANTPQPDATVTGDTPGGAKLLTTGWHSSAGLQIGADWVSGYYLVKLHDSVNGGESYANFVVRSTTPAKIVINLSTNTWEAYNKWGNLSLYRDARVTPAISDQTLVAHQVSFLRPYVQGYGAGGYFVYDRPLVDWAESHGYPVSYSTDDDLRHAREAGTQTKLVIFSGHEEYYSMADRTELLRLTAAGVSQAFFGGNAWAWQARFDDVAHVMSVWRKKSLDPSTVKGTKTVRWETIGMPQNQLTGELETWGSQTGGQSAYATSSWPWNGAGLVPGSDLGTLEGKEFDGIAVNSALAPNLLMLSRTPFSGMPGVPANQAMTLWQKTPSAFIFSAGQTGFNWNLSYPGVTPPDWVDPTSTPTSSAVSLPIERLVGNLIRRATGLANPIPAVGPSGTPAPFAILAPASGQSEKASPTPLSVAWSDPPAGTSAVNVYVDDVLVGTGATNSNVFAGPGVATLGAHTIRIDAVKSDGSVLDTLSEPVTVLAASDPAFLQNVQGISRLWGDDESGTEPVQACFLKTAP